MNCPITKSYQSSRQLHYTYKADYFSPRKSALDMKQIWAESRSSYKPGCTVKEKERKNSPDGSVTYFSLST